MRRALLVLVAAAIAAPAANAQALPQLPIRIVRVDLSPRAHAFGDAVRASVDIVVDRDKIDPDDVRFLPDFTPYQQEDELRTSRRDVGHLTELRYEVTLNCLTIGCVPASEPAIKETQSVTFKPARVVYRLNGHKRSTFARWPELHLVTQLAPNELAHAGEPLGAQVAAVPFLDDPSYRLSPALLQALLLVIAVVLTATGVAALRPYLRRAVPEPETIVEPAGPELTPLQRALAGLNWARAHGAAGEQRKALELLAEELENADDPELAEESRALAWSPLPPLDAQMTALAERVQVVAEEEPDAVVA